MLPIASPLLDWFYAHRRSLPFREDPTPYHVWVSEVMLQQTRMTAVLPYYERFMRKLPTPAALAACAPDRLHKLWEGLGYYSRADNLRRAAEVIVEKYGGALPTSYDELLALPGVGAYTAGAIASISYNLPVPAVDGNVLRVFARLCNDHTDVALPETKRRITAQVTKTQPADAPGDFNQALMELGALVCIPGEPKCAACPLSSLCEAYAAGSAAHLPAKTPKKPRRIENITVLLIRAEGKWLLERRAEHGLLAGMWQPPICIDFPAHTAADALKSVLPDAQIAACTPLAPSKHLFTHIEWRLSGWEITLSEPCAPPPGSVWAFPGEMNDYAIPNAFRAYKPILYTTEDSHE